MASLLLSVMCGTTNAEAFSEIPSTAFSYTVEEKIEEDSNDGGENDMLPDTGDGSRLWIWFALMAVSSACLAASVLGRKKKANNN